MRGIPESQTRLAASGQAELLSSAWDPTRSKAAMVLGHQEVLG